MIHVPKCSIYYRVSSGKQRDRHTIASQLRILPEYAKSQGWIIYDTYVDDGFSAETIEDRPAFSKLLEEAEQDCFDIVLSIDLDRIVRSKSSVQGAIIYDLFRTHNIKLATPTDFIDLSNEDQDLLAGIKRELAKWEKRKILGRMDRGRIEALKQGRYLGNNLPYGYRWNKQERKFEMHPDEAEVVRQIFRFSIEKNVGSRAIADFLNERNKPTRSQIAYPEKLAKYDAAIQGGKPAKRPVTYKWSSVVVDKILQNTAYFGESIANRVIGRNRITIRPKDEWIIIKVPPIVSKETWELAQQGRKKRKKYVKGNEKYPYLCNGILFCAVCGNRIGGRTDKGRKPGIHKERPYYTCYGRQSKWDGRCTLPYFRVEEVDQAVWQEIERLVKNPKLLEEAVSLQGDDEPEYAQSDVKKIEKCLEDNRTEQDAVLRLYRKGTISEAQLEKQLAEVQQEEKALLEQKQAIESGVSETQNKANQIATLQSEVEALRKNIDSFSFEQKRELVRVIAVGNTVNRVGAHTDGSLIIKGIIDFSGLGYKDSNILELGSDTHGGDVRKLYKSGPSAGGFRAGGGKRRGRNGPGPQPPVRRRDPLT